MKRPVMICVKARVVCLIVMFCSNHARPEPFARAQRSMRKHLWLGEVMLHHETKIYSILDLPDVAATPREARGGARQRLAINQAGSYSNQSPSRAPRAATRGTALFSCSAAARAACVSTWLGEAGSCRYQYHGPSCAAPSIEEEADNNTT